MSDETPETARARIVKLGSELTRAELDLKRARDEEVDAKHAYEAAHRRAMLSKDSPKVTRGGTTTAERDAWVDDQVSNEHLTYLVAEARRQSAKDHYETINTHSMLAMAILRSIDVAFNLVTRGQPG